MISDDFDPGQLQGLSAKDARNILLLEFSRRLLAESMLYGEGEAVGFVRLLTHAGLDIRKIANGDFSSEQAMRFQRKFSDNTADTEGLDQTDPRIRNLHAKFALQIAMTIYGYEDVGQGQSIDMAEDPCHPVAKLDNAVSDLSHFLSFSNLCYLHVTYLSERLEESHAEALAKALKYEYGTPIRSLKPSTDGTSLKIGPVLH